MARGEREKWVSEEEQQRGGKLKEKKSEQRSESLQCIRSNRSSNACRHKLTASDPQDFVGRHLSQFPSLPKGTDAQGQRAESVPPGDQDPVICLCVSIGHPAQAGFPAIVQAPKPGLCFGAISIPAPHSRKTPTRFDESRPPIFNCSLQFSQKIRRQDLQQNTVAERGFL